MLYAILLSFLSSGSGVEGGKLGDAKALLLPRAAALSTADEPTQSGIIANCNKFYDIVKGDSCFSVEQAFSITHSQFLAWNPAVSSDCSTNFWVGDSYCVGTGSAAVGTASKSALPSPDKPTQTGTVCNCNKWYDVVNGDSCASIEATFGITNAQFHAWNPAVSSDCSTNFWVGDSYCVGVSNAPCSSSSTASHSMTRLTSPDKPTQTGTIRTCNLWYDVVLGDSCSSIEAAFNITHAQFLAWNPAVSSDCSTNFWTGESYCVGVGSSSSTTRTTSIPYSVLPETTSSYVPRNITSDTAWPPSPTQSGQPSYCNNWKLVEPGDTCASIQARFSASISMDQFLAWNPAIGMDCGGLYNYFWVCVGIQAQTSAINTTTAASQSYPSYTPTPTPTFASPWVPSPTQSGIVSDCLAFYQATANDTCGSIIQNQGIVTLQDLETWNPALGSDCSGLVSGDWYCIIRNGSLPQPSVTTVAPAATQTGIVLSCNAWYQATGGDDCDSIVQSFGTFGRADFLSWNPAVGPSCSSMVVGDYYCVSVPSTPSTRTNSTGPTPLPTNGFGPQPEQPGIPGSCADYWLVGRNDNCTTITASNNITLSDFLAWNPALNADCSGLEPDYYVCVGMPSNATATTTSPMPVSATTTSSTSDSETITAATPSPVQSGMVSNCERFYWVEPGDGCFNLAQKAGIALSDFYAWNPAVKTDCSDLEARTYVCIGISGPRTTILSGTPVPAPTS